ncbi:MAG: hypothetical protein C0403_16575, partial [Desulfobacterium sp.]|nr:hypothetical protein [Desulfobacterium sp.]
SNITAQMIFWLSMYSTMFPGSMARDNSNRFEESQRKVKVSDCAPAKVVRGILSVLKNVIRQALFSRHG